LGLISNKMTGKLLEFIGLVHLCWFHWSLCIPKLYLQLFSTNFTMNFE
jgi:hypothetical protein